MNDMLEAAPQGSARLAVIGCAGRMGAMLVRHWQSAGYDVRGVDKQAGSPSGHELRPSGTGAPCAATLPESAALVEAVSGAAVVFLCVPAAAVEPVARAVAPLLDAGQILADITSVKMLPMQAMEACHKGPVVGTHPLFGAHPKPEDLLVAVTPGSRAREEDVRLVETLFSGFGCRTFRTTPEEHDRGAAYVQGLNFISSAAYFASLAHRRDVLPFLTPSFRRRLEAARKLLTEDAGMFQCFTSANPMTRDAVHTFRLFLDLVESGGLAEVAERAAWWYTREDKNS